MEIGWLVFSYESASRTLELNKINWDFWRNKLWKYYIILHIVTMKLQILQWSMLDLRTKSIWKANIRTLNAEKLRWKRVFEVIDCSGAGTYLSSVINLVGTVSKNRMFLRLYRKIRWGHVSMSPYIPAPHIGVLSCIRLYLMMYVSGTLILQRDNPRFQRFFLPYFFLHS